MPSESYKDEYARKIETERNALKEHKPNIMVIGGSGTGKSSLINHMFGKEVAETGVGEPVTAKINFYSSPETFVNIFDSMGYETKYGDYGQAFEELVLKEIERRKGCPLSEQIHIIVYCISIMNHRVFDYDIRQIKDLSKTHIPVFIALTKCDQDSLDDQGRGETAQAFKKVLRDGGLENKIFEVATQGEDAGEFEQLTKEMSDSLTDELYQEAFNVAQIRNLTLIRKSAHKIIHYASLAAAAVTVTPIPMADSALLVPIQITMATKLAELYKLPAMGASVSAILQSQLMKIIGKKLVLSVLKLVPVLGIVINASVSISLTEGLGWALVLAYEQAIKEYLETGREPVLSRVLTSYNFPELIAQYITSNSENKPLAFLSKFCC